MSSSTSNIISTSMCYINHKSKTPYTPYSCSVSIAIITSTLSMLLWLHNTLWFPYTKLPIFHRIPACIKTETSQSGIVAYVFVNKHWIFMANFFSTAGSEDLDMCLWPNKSINLRSLKKSVDYPQPLNYPSISSRDTMWCRYYILCRYHKSITQKHIKKRQQMMQKVYTSTEQHIESAHITTYEQLTPRFFIWYLSGGL